MTKTKIRNYPKTLSHYSLTTAITIISYFLAVNQAVAASGNSLVVATPTTNNNAKAIINQIFGNIYTLFVYVAGGLAVIYIMWAGITFITSAGNPKKAEEAKNSLINAFTGVVILSSTYAIIRLAISVGSLIARSFN